MARNTRTFTDFDLNFTAHPVTGDIAVKSDEASIKQSVSALVQTQNYERPFHSEIGSQVRSLLFEPASPMTAVLLQRSIEDVINSYEPRVDLQSVNISYSPDNYSINVTVNYKIINTETPQQIDLILQRTR